MWQPAKSLNQSVLQKNVRRFQTLSHHYIFMPVIFSPWSCNLCHVKYNDWFLQVFLFLHECFREKNAGSTTTCVHHWNKRRQPDPTEQHPWAADISGWPTQSPYHHTHSSHSHGNAHGHATRLAQWEHSEGQQQADGVCQHESQFTVSGCWQNLCKWGEHGQIQPHVNSFMHACVHTHSNTLCLYILIYKFHTVISKNAELKFSLALHAQRPLGLLGTGSPGRPPQLSHSSWAAKCR